MSYINAISYGITINSIKVNDLIKIMCRYHQYFIYRYDGIVNAIECKSLFGKRYIEKQDFDKDNSTPSRFSNKYVSEIIVHKFTLVQDEDEDENEELPQQYKYYKDFNDILLENICTIDNKSFDNYNYDIGVSAYKINRFKYTDDDVIFLPISQIICSKDISDLDSYRTESIMESTKPYVMLPPINVTHTFRLSDMFMVYDGEHRFNMSKELGYTHIPVIINN